MQTAEEWKPVRGLEGLYLVSSLGRVYSTRSKLILKGRKTHSGYLRVNLPGGDNKRDTYVHRLVAEMFCERPDGCDVVNHIDNNPQNNSASNLEWTTQRGNVMHAMGQGRVHNFPNAKMIIGIKDGKEYKFRSVHEAADFIGRNHKTILYHCKTGNIGSDGFLWKKVV